MCTELTSAPDLQCSPGLQGCPLHTHVFMTCSVAQEQQEPAKREAVLSLLPMVERELVEQEMAKAAEWGPAQP